MLEKSMAEGVGRTGEAPTGPASDMDSWVAASAFSNRQADPCAGRTRARFLIVAMLFLVTTLNYADRATLSITGSSIQHSMGISPVVMGYIFSSFAWSYVMAQIPGGWLLDRFGTK